MCRLVLPFAGIFLTVAIVTAAALAARPAEAASVRPAITQGKASSVEKAATCWRDRSAWKHASRRK